MAPDIPTVVLTGVWVMLPAYVPNSVAVVVGGGPPIDGGRLWHGTRLLGDGKTWRGFLGGTVAGAGVAVGLNVLRPSVSAALPSFPVSVVIALPLGAMLGDAAGSFVKRRTGRERGARFPLVDQFSFVCGALLLSVLLAPSWTFETFTPPVLLVALALTPLLHRGTNGLAYYLGLKDVPW
ncbi:CDP-2,3-bis-(O-geranylgeranyl)-sn-glycerol synthase [Haloarchaeobius baliensis]|uniref:CDP-2,3-bis-(O-geranylgeranyl)-sn-glycerol synthase n=1 Tax=Haloarchaeobius baliensis TaxID=1670458 RepID=UPI003F880F3F